MFRVILPDSRLQHSFGISETVSCVDLVNSSCVEEHVIYKAIFTLLSLCVQTILCFCHPASHL